MIMLRAAVALACLVLSGPALAQITGALPPAPSTTPALKREAVITSDLVRIGDLIENAGASARVPIFRAPDLGHTGKVAASRVIDAVRPHGFTIVDTNGITEVTVTRAVRLVSLKDLETQVTAALARRSGVGAAEDLTVTLDRETRPVQLEPGSGELQAARVYYEPRSGRFDITFEVPRSAMARRNPLRVVGVAIETTAVPVLTRPLNRGDLMRVSDVAIERRPKSEVRGDVTTSTADLVGLAARRPLRAGELVRISDLMKPELVQRNEAVTLVYEAPGLVLTIRGKALDAGTQGDLINVLNLQSKRTVQGTISGPGRVTIAAVHVREPSPATEPAGAARNE
jgi:flagella basal body P-ring formation protein FlgA